MCGQFPFPYQALVVINLRRHVKAIREDLIAE